MATAPTPQNSNRTAQRFLIVTPLVPPEPGGPSYYSVALQAALERAGHRTLLLAFREVRRYPTGIRHAIFFYKVFRAVRDVDTLIILDTVSVALPAVLAGWLRRKTTVIRTGGDFVWEHYIERTNEKVRLSEFYSKERSLSSKERILVSLQKHVVLRLVDTIVFSTAWQRDIWGKPYGIPLTKTAVIENSYPPHQDPVPGGTDFICAWRPTGFKNIDTLETAYERARKRCPDIKLDLLKNSPREQLHAHMRNARALIVPSLSEVSPNMVMEALSMGLPALVTTDCGTKDRFGDAVTWIDPTDPDAIAASMCALSEDVGYEKARQAARAYIFSRGYDVLAREFIALSTKDVV
jgi:glycosyltransferase involved in cell wall biosynthesis